MADILVGGSKPYIAYSREVECHDCYTKVYISPSAFPMLDRLDPPPVMCAECTLKRVRGEDQVSKSYECRKGKSQSMHQACMHVLVPAQGSSEEVINLTTTIIAPDQAWCFRHWKVIRDDQSINSVFAAFRIVTRILEMDRFYDDAYGKETKPESPDILRINEHLRKIVPLCCWLGEEEMNMLVLEAREINKQQPKS